MAAYTKVPFGSFVRGFQPMKAMFSSFCQQRIIQNINKQHAVRIMQTFSRQGRRQSNFRNFHLGPISFTLAVTLLHNTDDGSSSSFQAELRVAEEKIKSDDKVILALKQARLAEYKENYDAAIRFYHHALALLDSYAKDGTWCLKKIIKTRVYIFDSLANLALSQGNYDEAEVLFKETMKGLLQREVPKTDNAMVEISLKLAIIYAAQNRDTEAETGYKFCLKSLKTKMDNEATRDDPDNQAMLGMCVDAYARFLLQRNRHSEAIEKLRKALAIAKKSLGAEHPQVAVLYNDLATASSLAKKYPEAKKYGHLATKVAEISQSPDLPLMYCNLGMIYLQMESFKEAANYCRKGLNVAMKLKDEETEKYAKKCLKKIKEVEKEAAAAAPAQ